MKFKLAYESQGDLFDKKQFEAKDFEDALNKVLTNEEFNDIYTEHVEDDYDRFYLCYDLTNDLNENIEKNYYKKLRYKQYLKLKEEFEK